MVYQIDGDNEQNRMQVKFSSKDQTGDLGVRSNIIKFRLPCQFQRFLYQILCVFSQMKDTKHIRRDFILLPGSCPRGGTLGHWGYPVGQTFF